MKKSHYSEYQIINILKEAEAGKKTKDVCREYGISSATFYNGKAKYSGMQSSDVKRLRELEDENRCLKKMFAELSLDYQILKEIIKKKL